MAKRRLLNLLTGLSLLLCVAVAALWARSKHETDTGMVAVSDGPALVLTSHAGCWLEVTAIPRGWPDSGIKRWSGRKGPLILWKPAQYFWGVNRRILGVLVSQFSCRRGTIVVPRQPSDVKPHYDGAWAGITTDSPDWLFLPAWELRVPHAGIVAATSLPPALWLSVLAAGRARRSVRRYRDRTRRGAGLSTSCGYDLTGNLSGVCPECRDATA